MCVEDDEPLSSLDVLLSLWSFLCEYMTKEFFKKVRNNILFKKKLDFFHVCEIS